MFLITFCTSYQKTQNMFLFVFQLDSNLTPGGALNFFSGRGVRPGFLKCGACELTFASEKGGLWAEIFQIWRLVSWKFPNLGACELKFFKFGGLWAKIWVKIEAVEAKISKFSQKGVLWTDSFAWNPWDPCEWQERREKGVFRAAHPHTPFLSQCPPGSNTMQNAYMYTVYITDNDFTTFYPFLYMPYKIVLYCYIL